MSYHALWLPSVPTMPAVTLPIGFMTFFSITSSIVFFWIPLYTCMLVVMVGLCVVFQTMLPQAAFLSQNEYHVMNTTTYHDRILIILNVKSIFNVTLWQSAYWCGLSLWCQDVNYYLNSIFLTYNYLNYQILKYVP